MAFQISFRTFVVLLVVSSMVSFSGHLELPLKHAVDEGVVYVMH